MFCMFATIGVFANNDLREESSTDVTVVEENTANVTVAVVELWFISGTITCQNNFKSDFCDIGNTSEEAITNALNMAILVCTGKGGVLNVSMTTTGGGVGEIGY